MSAELIFLETSSSAFRADIQVRLRRMASILKAIESGELLAALPECPLAREHHLVALDLLVTLESEINTLAEQLE